MTALHHAHQPGRAPRLPVDGGLIPQFLLYDDAQPACVGVDPELFFPEGQGAASPRAKRVCRACPVAGECLAYALDHREQGVWGGTTYRERQAIRARQERVDRRVRRRAENTAEALRLRAAGMPIVDIAGRMGVHKDSVSRWFAAHNKQAKEAVA